MSRRKPVEHGTERGYAAHRRHGAPACAPCKAAHSKYSFGLVKAKKEKNPPPPRMSMPLELFAELYWAANAEVLAILDRGLGKTRVDNLIKKADQHQEQDPG